MYAIVEIAGQQFKVEKDQQIFVHQLAGKEGDKVDFSDVLLIDNDGSVVVGAPAIEGAKVTGKILRHAKGDKVIVFKKKRRKGYKKRNGHRQHFTELKIEDIVAKGAKAAPKKAAAKKEEAPAKKAAPKKAAAKGDDLKKIEGIGPKMAEIFVNSGLDTFAKFAAAGTDKIKEILAEAGPRYAKKECSTWCEQAQMAADGKWDELKKWQDELDGGKA